VGGVVEMELLVGKEGDEEAELGDEDSERLQIDTVESVFYEPEFARVVVTLAAKLLEGRSSAGRRAIWRVSQS